MENEKLISDRKEVCEKLNSFYVNIACETGINSTTFDSENHPSILAFKENSPDGSYTDFSFRRVIEAEVLTTINK